MLPRPSLDDIKITYTTPLNTYVVNTDSFKLLKTPEVVPVLGVEEHNTQNTAADDYGGGILSTQCTSADNNGNILMTT